MINDAKRLLQHYRHKADIAAKLLTKERGAADRGEYRQAAGAVAPHWVKVKNPNAPAVKCEAEEDWGR